MIKSMNSSVVNIVLGRIAVAGFLIYVWRGPLADLALGAAGYKVTLIPEAGWSLGEIYTVTALLSVGVAAFWLWIERDHGFLQKVR